MARVAPAICSCVIGSVSALGPQKRTRTNSNELRWMIVRYPPRLRAKGAFKQAVARGQFSG